MRAKARRLKTAIQRLYARIRLLWRWVSRIRWWLFEHRRDEDLSGYRTPIQVCPRGCEYHELARRELVARTRLTGRAATHVTFRFEIANCPKCGAQLTRTCARCRRSIVAPLANLCHFCGLPQPWASERRAGVERASLLRWSKGDRRAHSPANALYAVVGGGNGDIKGKGDGKGGVWVIEGDVSQLDVHTVISDNDIDGQMWAQVARAIKVAAGEGVERLAQEGKPYKLGDAWWTSAGALRQMRGIVHVATMNRNGESKLDVVRKCLRNAFRVAGEHRCESIGVATIGSGPASISLPRWSRMFAEVAVGHLDQLARKRDSEKSGPEQTKTPQLSIVLVLFERPNFAADRALLERAIFRAWVKAGRPKTGVPEVNLSRPRRAELTIRGDIARRGAAFRRLFKAPEDADQKSDEPSVAPRNKAAPENAA